VNENDGCLAGNFFEDSTIDPKNYAGIRAGVDRVELAEFDRILAMAGDGFLAAVYTDGERHDCSGRLERLATRFAAKEAASKALGTGLRGVMLREIEVVSEAIGQPRLQLHGRARDRADALGIVSMSVSLTHTSMVGEAFVVALTAGAAETPLRKESAS
jgi:holo-[acyl-carrier protein] synthase